ncbi:MAG TPA: hypothetical protein PK095_15595, partial [Myxococcota bacterium]|nr:hypothetical protein [Myxococcota bacterium]
EVLNQGFGALNLDPAYRGRVELHNALAVAEGKIEELQAELEAAKARITALEARPTIVWSANVSSAGAILRDHGAVLIAGAVTVDASTPGQYDIQLPASLNSYLVAGIDPLAVIGLKTEFTWVNDGLLRVIFRDNSNVLTAANFSIQITGRLN